MALVNDIRELEYGLGGCKDRWNIMMITAQNFDHSGNSVYMGVYTVRLLIKTDAIKQYKDVFNKIYYNSVGTRKNLYKSLIGMKRSAERLNSKILSVGFVNYQYLYDKSIDNDNLSLLVSVVDDDERYYSAKPKYIGSSRFNIKYQYIDQEYFIDSFTWNDFIEYAIDHITEDN